MKLLALSLALAAADALPGFLRGIASHDEVTPTMAPGHRKLPHYPKCEDTFGGVCEDSRGCDDDSRCFDGSECSTLAGEECDDWAGGESTETRGRCNGELDDADEDNKEDS